MDLQAIPLTAANLGITAGVLIALMGVVLLILQVIKTYREVKQKPTSQSESHKPGEIDTMKADLANVKADLSTVQNNVNIQRNDTSMIMDVLLVMLQHDITGDHVHDMEQTYAKFSQYLIRKE